MGSKAKVLSLHKAPLLFRFSRHEPRQGGMLMKWTFYDLSSSLPSTLSISPIILSIDSEYSVGLKSS